MSDELKEIAEPLDDGLIKDFPPEDDKPLPKRKKEQPEHKILMATGNRKNNEPNWDMGLSSGFEMLNLACSGRIDVAFAPDYYYVWTGSSGSGKTFITLASLAEASINPKYKDHRLIFDCPERGAMMKLEKFYGKRLAERIEPPAGTRDNPVYSHTLETMYHNVHNAIAKGPCVYLLDSMDPLATNDELRNFLKKNKKMDKYIAQGGIPAEEAGSYGTERARVNSSHLRLIYNELQGSNCIWIVIFQSRQNMNRLTSQMQPETRGGGNAPTFYAGIELWSSVAGHLKTKYKEKPIEQGVVCKVRTRKGRITGKDRTIRIPIYHSAGIDTIGGMVDYLVEWKHWAKAGSETDPQEGRIEAQEFEVKLKREKLVQHICSNNLEDKLRQIVLATWNEIEETVSVTRKNRYE